MTRSTLLALSLLLGTFGCSKGGDDTVDTDTTGDDTDTDVTDTDTDTHDTDTQDTDTGDTDVANPSLAITSPSESATEYASFDVTYTVGDFTLDPDAIGGANVDGHGHVHWYVDGVYQDATADTTIHLHDLARGAHVVTLKLASNDHTELGVEASVDVTVLAPSVVITSPASGTTQNVSSTYLSLAFTDWNIVDKVGDAAAMGEGHYHVFVDGTYFDYGTNPTTFTVTRLDAGTHTVDVELVNNDHTSLDPAASASVTFTVSKNPYYVELSNRGDFSGVEWDSSTIPLDVLVKNLNLAPGEIGGKNVAGDGHYHIYVDGTYVEASGYSEEWLFNQAPGEHLVEVALASNDHTELGAVDWERVTITADRPDVDWVSPADGDTLTGTSTIQVTPANFTFDAASMGGKPVTDEGHWKIWLSDYSTSDPRDFTALDETASNTYSLTSSQLLPYEDQDLTIRAELVNNDGTSLTPPVYDDVTVHVNQLYP